MKHFGYKSYENEHTTGIWQKEGMSFWDPWQDDFNRVQSAILNLDESTKENAEAIVGTAVFGIYHQFNVSPELLDKATRLCTDLINDDAYFRGWASEAMRLANLFIELGNLMLVGFKQPSTDTESVYSEE